MEGILEKKGRLDAVFARGWLSALEAAGLEAGGILLGQTAAGAGVELCYEGRWIGRGEIYIVGDKPGTPLFGLRLASLEKEAREAPEPIRSEGLVDLIPFELVTGSASYSLGELGGASPGTIISLDTEAQGPSPVTLRLAGLEAGRGRAVVQGERLGILLDEVPARAPCPAFATGLYTTGSWLPPNEVAGNAHLKLYDFAKPDRFTRRSIDAICELHTRAAEDLSRRHPALGPFTVGLVDQLTWGEWVEGHGSGGLLLRSRFERPGRAYERGLWPERRGLPLVQPAEPRFPLSPGLGERIERWTAEEESIFAEKTLVLALQGSLESLAPPDLLHTLGGAWRLVTDSGFAPARDFGPCLAWDLGPEGQAGHSPEGPGLFRDMMVALVVLEAPAGRIDLVYSAAGIYPLTAALERHERFGIPR